MVLDNRILELPEGRLRAICLKLDGWLSVALAYRPDRSAKGIVLAATGGVLFWWSARDPVVFFMLYGDISGLILALAWALGVYGGSTLSETGHKGPKPAQECPDSGEILFYP